MTPNRRLIHQPTNDGQRHEYENQFKGLPC